MTRRENFLKALKHEKQERLSAFVVIDNFNYPQPLPQEIDIARIASFADDSGFVDPEAFVELSKYYGLDTLLRITPSPVKVECNPSQTAIRSETLDKGWIQTIYDTPVGNLKSISAPSEEANTVFMIEHPIKEIEDYDVFKYYLESQIISLNEKNLSEAKRHLEIVNDEGIAYAVGPSTPIMDLARVWVGLEKLIYHIMDEPEKIEAVLDIMAENCYRQYELIAENSECEVVVFWDDSNSLYLTPRMFEKYSVPVMRRFADIVHKNGKILVCHTCGSINAFLEQFKKTGIDAVDWVTPTPTGDINPKQVQDVWGSKITMMLSVLPDVMRNGTPDQVEEHINTILHGLEVKENLVLMIAPPGGTPLDNLKRAVKTLTEKYGVVSNRSEKFGSIMEPSENLVWTNIGPTEVPR